VKHYLFASLTIVALFVLAWADAPAWLNLGIAGLLLTPLVFHVDDLKQQIRSLEWAIEGSDELVSDLKVVIDIRNAEIRELQKSAGQEDVKARHANLCRNLQQEVDRAKKVFTYPKITPQTTDRQHFELVRMSVEEKLEWMYFILSKSLETLSQQEDREIQREQESVYNNGLGL